MPNPDAGLSGNVEAVVRVTGASSSSFAADEAGLITFFRVRSNTALRDGKLAMPICARPGTTKGWEVIRCYIPNAALRVDWTAWRKEKYPEKPAPYVKGGAVLLHASIDLDNLEMEGDARNYFISSGSYYYVWPDRSMMSVTHALPPYIELPNKGVLCPEAPTWLSGVIDAGWPNYAANSKLNKF